MISVAEARTRVQSTLTSKGASWASDPSVAESTIVNIPLRPPTENDALVDQYAAEAWVREWAAIPTRTGIAIGWADRRWRALGRQRVPTNLTIVGADAIADFAGGESARRYRGLRVRASAVRSRLGTSPEIVTALRRQAANIGLLADDDFARLLDVVAWLLDHPVAGLRPRQLPIRGVDTKWVGAHRALVMALFTAVTGRDNLGLVLTDPLVRLRVLDPALAPGGLDDFAAPPSVLDRLPIAPPRILIVENLETMLAMPPAQGWVVLHGSGFAVDVVGALSWVRSRPVLYWGDLDSHGFAILHRLRSTHANVTSVLMDTGTLMQHRDLWVTEPAPAVGTYPTLTESESSTMLRLREEGNVRLEQERIPWGYALETLGLDSRHLA